MYEMEKFINYHIPIETANFQQFQKVKDVSCKIKLQALHIKRIEWRKGHLRA